MGEPQVVLLCHVLEDDMLERFLASALVQSPRPEAIRGIKKTFKKGRVRGT